MSNNSNTNMHDDSIEQCLTMVGKHWQKRASEKFAHFGEFQPSTSPLACDDSQSACEWFLQRLQPSLVANVRFYLRDRSSAPSVSIEDSQVSSVDRFVSTACAGLPAAVAKRIEQGEIARFIESSNQSSICVAEKQPVILHVEENLKLPEQREGVGMFKAFGVPNGCGFKLDQGERTYIDFPVYVNGELFGKFSCDLCTNDLLLISEDDILEWWVIAQKLAIGICRGIEQEQREVIRKSNSILIEKETNYWVELHTRLWELLSLNLDNAELTFFRGVSRSCDSDSAVLWFAENTSDKSLEGFLRSGESYQRQSPLVTAVAHFRKPLRFVNVKNSLFRDGYNCFYGIEIDWDHDPVFKNWGDPDSVMAIPVFDFRRKLSGVYVIVDRGRKSDLGFSLLDEWNAGLFLNRFTARLEEQRTPSLELNANEEEDVFRRIRERIENAFDPADEAIELLHDLCGNDESKHFYGVCGVEDSDRGSSLFVVRSGGALSYSESISSYPLAGTISKEANRISDRWAYRRSPCKDESSLGSIAEGAICEGAVAFKLGAGHAGAVVIKSDKFDIEGTADIVNYIAKCLAANLLDRGVYDVADLFKEADNICS